MITTISVEIGSQITLFCLLAILFEQESIADVNHRVDVEVQPASLFLRR
jgi:hypothetical protein